jgi:hypothetical protein
MALWGRAQWGGSEWAYGVIYPGPPTGVVILLDMSGGFIKGEMSGGFR